MKIKGIKQTCSDTKGLVLPDEWIEIFYDLEEKKVWSVYHRSANIEWTEYKDSSIVRVGAVFKATTQKDILAMLRRNVLDRLYPEVAHNEN